VKQVNYNGDAPLNVTGLNENGERVSMLVERDALVCVPDDFNDPRFTQEIAVGGVIAEPAQVSVEAGEVVAPQGPEPAAEAAPTQE
jgi:hypothetical protein